jgi:hypothetical protein
MNAVLTAVALPFVLKAIVVTGREAYQPHARLQAHFARRQSQRSDRCMPIVIQAQRQFAVGVWILAIMMFALRPLHASDVDFPVVEPLHTIFVEAETVAKEVRGIYDVLAFEGSCKLRQGELQATGDKLTLWIERRNQLGMELPGKIICQIDGHADIIWDNHLDRRLRDNRWMGRLFSLKPVDFRIQREVKRHDIPNLDWSGVQQAQFTQSGNGGQVLAPPLLGDSSRQNPGAATGAATGVLPRPTGSTSIPSTPGAVQWSPGGSTSSSSLLPSTGLVIPEDGSQPYPAAGIAQTPAENIPPFPVAGQVALQVPTSQPNFGARSVEFLPKGNGELNFSYVPDPRTGESIAQIRGGFKLIVRDVQVAQSNGAQMELGTVTLEADNAVVWLKNVGTTGGGFVSTPDRPIELYLDGNIVFYQGQRVIYADRMYYNVSSEYGMVLSAEILTPVPQYQGLLRLKADVLQQRNRQNYMAYGAAITSSRLGVPRYWLQANEVSLQDERSESEVTSYDTLSGSRPTNMRATSTNNFVYLGGVPVGYWPTFSTNLSKPSFYLTSLKYKNDTIFGNQVYSEFDAYQLLGIDGPDGTALALSADYLSDRGPAGGFRFDYQRPTIFFGIPGQGTSDGWFIKDSGLDTLGRDRIGLTPEKELRGRLYSRQRLFVNPNLEILAESGWVSDRNLLEQYFERDWDQQKDLSTDLRLRRYNGNRMLDIWGQARVNEFFTETERLPQIDHYWLGQDLFNQRLTYNQHTNVGYVHQKTASTPLDPKDAATFALLPWETDSEGVRAATRQELSMPLQLGAWKVIPYLSGEAAFFNEDITQNDVTRLTGQAGLKTSLPFWRAYPNLDSRLFDIRGIAHKVTLESEFFYADSTANLNQLPLYDPLDDNSQEHFRRRMIFNTFGGALPPQFDERGAALRTGMQRWVTASSTEVVDDLSQIRWGINQRWQTKRGLPGRDRIVDLVKLDVNWILYPQANRDNFGQEAGALNYDFRYNVGDRLTLLSDGFFDFFSQGLKTVSAGAKFSRPGRADAYIGLLSLEGPISSNVINGNVNYRLNEKWIFTGSAASDLSKVGNIGQSLALTRVGESALIRFGVYVDSGRDNVSFNFNIEPRFLPTKRLGSVGGQFVPPAGLYGLE